MFACIPFILATVISMPMPEVTDYPAIISNTRSDWGGYPNACNVQTFNVINRDTGKIAFNINYGGCII